MVQCRAERKRSAVRRTTAGELALSSETRFPLGGVRSGDGGGTKLCVLTQGGLSASANER